MGKKIIINFKRKSEMRFPFYWGDWYEKDDCIIIDVFDSPDWRSNLAIAFHELKEKFECDEKGITVEAVEKWDTEHQDADDPGVLEGCPYRGPHISAMGTEYQVVLSYGLTPEEHERKYEEAFNNEKRS